MLQQSPEAGAFCPVAAGKVHGTLRIAQVEATVPGHQKLAPHSGLRFKKLHLPAALGQLLGGQQAGWAATDYRYA